MKRFITYLYDYTGAVRGKNTGFIKVDVRGMQCRMEIHIRGLGQVTGSGTVYLIIEDAGLVGVKAGDMEIRRGQGDYGTIIKCSPIGKTPYEFGQIVGVAVAYDREKMTASRWKEDENVQLALPDIRIWEPPQLEEIPQTAEAKKTSAVRQEAAEKKEVLHAEEEMHAKEERHAEEEMHAMEERHAMKAQQAQCTGGCKRQSAPMPQRTEKMPGKEPSWETQWQLLREQKEPISDFRREQGGSWIKIDVKDIRRLPKRNWYLGNNSFLLHGFFNYHYLIVGREMDGKKERWYLGIPGFYQQQERVMATIFGFPEFFNSQNGREPFGYWIHSIEME